MTQEQVRLEEQDNDMNGGCMYAVISIVGALLVLGFFVFVVYLFTKLGLIIG